MEKETINFEQKSIENKRPEYLSKNDKLAEKILEDIANIEKQENNGEELGELSKNDKKAEQICSVIEDSTDFYEQKKLLQELWGIYDKAREPLQKTVYQKNKDLVRNLSELIDNLSSRKKEEYEKEIKKIVVKPKKGIKDMQEINKNLWHILRKVRKDLISAPKKEKGKKELRMKIKNVYNDILKIISKNFKVEALKQRANDINEKLNQNINIKDLEDILSEMVLIRSDIREIIGAVEPEKAKKAKNNIKKREMPSINKKEEEEKPKITEPKKSDKKEKTWILKLSEEPIEQEKIEKLYKKILELARNVNIYKGIGEEALRKIAENKTIELYNKYNK